MENTMENINSEISLYEYVNNYLLTEASIYSYLKLSDYEKLCYNIANNSITRIDAIKFLRNATATTNTKYIDCSYITDNYPTNQFVMFLQQSTKDTEKTYNDVDICLRKHSKISCKVAADIINFLWDNIDYYDAEVF